MKQFKISIIISLLLSVIAVTAVFAAEGFKNTIMAIEFEPVSDNSVNMIVSTKTPYSGTINPVKKDANTFIIMLPDTESLTSSPDYSKTGSISSVSIRTMAGTQTNSGYTKITVTTAAPISITGKSTIYVPKENTSKNEARSYVPYTSTPSEQYNYSPVDSTYNSAPAQSKEVSAVKEKKSISSEKSDYDNSNISKKEEETVEDNPVPAEQDYAATENKKNSNEIFLVIMGILLIITCSIFFYVKAKNKLTQIAGESLDIDVTEESEEKPKPAAKKSIRNTIKTLDKKYANPSKMPVVSEYTQPAPQMNAEKSTDDMNIVDLDELFNEQIKNSDNNDALDDFLSEFSFEENEVPEEKSETFDEETFQQVMANDNIKFTKSDMERIKNLLKLEINDETLRDIKKYAVSNPIKNSESKKLENMVASLSISHNISFDKDDILALNKLMNVEIDRDFVTDLRTNAKRTAEMEREILETQVERKKPSEIITLSVSEFLPDLEDVMKHPEKYEDPEPEKVVVNAEDLLKSIENVTFKPFDDGTRDFEILNDFDDEPVAELYSEDFAADNNIHEPKEVKPETKPIEPAPVELKPAPKTQISKTNERKPEIKPAVKTVETNAVQKNKTSIKCLLDGKSYDVVSSVKLGENLGCHLAKDDDGYVVLQYFENKLGIIKQYKNLKSETIQARLSEKNADGSMRYIIRIGMAKFIADVKDNCINYVMDL